MKKVIIATILVLILGGYYLYDNMFPVAEPIEYPLIEDTISIDILTEDNEKTYIECPYEGIYTIDDQIIDIIL